MIRNAARRLMALLACMAAITAIVVIAGSITGDGRATAQANDEEKKAFDDAKTLGTVEAWDAFLSHYSKGFYADLARAYVKKLAEPDPPSQTPAAAPPAQAFEYPMVAGTWGGVVRSAPGQESDRVASLKEGEQVTLMAPPVFASLSDYPWFKIAFRDGQKGYMWGGILCSAGAERPDLYKTCPFTPAKAGNTNPPIEQPSPKSAASGDRPSWCSGSTNGAETAICQSAELISLDNVLNVAYRRAKSDSPNARNEIEQEQRRWLGRRNLCDNDPVCVRKRYNEQIQFLEGFYGN